MSLEYTKVFEEEGEVVEILKRDYMPYFRKGYVRIGPDRVFLPEYYLEFANKIRDLEVREDDVWVMSHPKAGTTWVQEMVWCIKNDLDFEGAKELQAVRFPFLEITTLADYRNTHIQDKIPQFLRNSVQFVIEQESPRFIKTHLPWSLLPQQIQDGTKQPKIIYICRSPKDNCVSYYHHAVLLEGYTGNFDDFCELFLEDSMPFAPFWSHLLGFWKRRDQPNILFLKFEDMKKDLATVIRKTADFLEKSLTDKQVSVLAEHLSFENMKNNMAVNKESVITSLHPTRETGQFIRGGRVGDGEKTMKEEVRERFDALTEKHLRGAGLEY